MKLYEKKFLDIGNGETLAYIEAGTGINTVLLIHGNMSSSVHWTPLIERLEKNYRIYAVDMRGFGDSTYNNRFSSINELAGDLALFCKKLGLKNIAVAGWSTGGGVALSLAANHHEIVGQLILVDSMSYRGYPIFKKDSKNIPLIGMTYATKEDMTLDPVQVAPALKCINEKDYNFMDYLWGLTIYTAGKKPSQEDQHIYLTETFKERCLIDLDWSLATFNISKTPTSYSLGNGDAAKIMCPIVSFWGDKDITVPGYMAQENVIAFPQLRFEIIHDSGHSPINDQTDVLAEKFSKYLK